MTDKNYDYFLTVVREKNITRAAEKLFISQPALSKYISRLEDSLGVPLLERIHGNVRPTYAGTLYAGYLEDARNLEKRFQQSLSEIRSDERGLIRLGITPFRSSIIMPGILPTFRARHPNIKIELTEGITADLIRALDEEKIDFCIADLTSNINYDLFEYDPLLDERVLLGLGIHSRLTASYVPDPEKLQLDNRRGIYPPFDVSRIAGEPFFMTNIAQSMSYLVENALHQKGIHLTNVFRSSNLMTAINLAASGMGFAFVPEFGVRQGAIPSSLLLFTMKDMPILWKHALFFKRGTFVSSHSRKLIRLMKETYGEY